MSPPNKGETTPFGLHPDKLRPPMAGKQADSSRHSVTLRRDQRHEGECKTKVKWMETIVEQSESVSGNSSGLRR